MAGNYLALLHYFVNVGVVRGAVDKWVKIVVGLIVFEAEARYFVYYSLGIEGLFVSADLALAVHLNENEASPL